MGRAVFSEFLADLLCQPEVCVRYTVDQDDRIQFRSRRRFLVRAAMVVGVGVGLPAAAAVQREPGQEGLLSWAWTALEAWWTGGCATTDSPVAMGQAVVPVPQGQPVVPPPEPEPEAPSTEDAEAPQRKEMRENRVMGRLPVRRAPLGSSKASP